MNFKKEIEKFFKRKGETAWITVGQTRHTVKALIEPMRYKNKLYLEASRTVLGFKDSECFLYLGPALPDFAGKEASTKIETENAAYIVSRADRILLSGETQYIWAVLMRNLAEENNEQ